MYEYGGLRKFRELYCLDLKFANVSFHGEPDIYQKLPDSFIVSLTPTSLARLKLAWIAVTTEVQITGVFLRDYDVKSSLQRHRVNDVKILLRQMDQNYIHCELQCSCIKSGGIFNSELKLHNKWFE